MRNFRELFEKVGALPVGHFRRSCGAHALKYANKIVALAPASHGAAFAEEIADYFEDYSIDALVAPELGAVSLMVEVSSLLHKKTGDEYLRIIATKIPGTNPSKFEIARDQARLLNGRRVLVVDDVVCSGETLNNVIDVVRDAGAAIVAVTGLWNTDPVHLTPQVFGVGETFFVIEEEIPYFTPGAETCPGCRDGIPLDKVLGHGS